MAGDGALLGLVGRVVKPKYRDQARDVMAMGRRQGRRNRPSVSGDRKSSFRFGGESPYRGKSGEK